VLFPAYPKNAFELLLGDYAEIGEWIMQDWANNGFVWLPAGGTRNLFSSGRAGF
jgi:hypothetical protein